MNLEKSGMRKVSEQKVYYSIFWEIIVFTTTYKRLPTICYNYEGMLLICNKRRNDDFNLRAKQLFFFRTKTQFRSTSIRKRL